MFSGILSSMPRGITKVITLRLSVQLEQENQFSSINFQSDKHKIHSKSLKDLSKASNFTQRSLTSLSQRTKAFYLVWTETNRQTHVRVYNLAQQVLTKKLLSGSRWISSLHIHPGGDNLIISSYDQRVCWFDLDLDDKPYKILKYVNLKVMYFVKKLIVECFDLLFCCEFVTFPFRILFLTFRYHKKAIRGTAFHARYPLFASCSDDGHVHIFHGMVYNDLLQNAFIVPLKILKGHNVSDDLGKGL